MGKSTKPDSSRKLPKFTTGAIIELVEKNRWPIHKLYRVVLRLDSSATRLKHLRFYCCCVQGTEETLLSCARAQACAQDHAKAKALSKRVQRVLECDARYRMRQYDDKNHDNNGAVADGN